MGWVSSSGRAAALVVEASDGFPLVRVSLLPDSGALMGFLPSPEDTSIRCPSLLPSVPFTADTARPVRRLWSVLPASTDTSER